MHEHFFHLLLFPRIVNTYVLVLTGKILSRTILKVTLFEKYEVYRVLFLTVLSVMLHNPPRSSMAYVPLTFCVDLKSVVYGKSVSVRRVAEVCLGS